MKGLLPLEAAGFTLGIALIVRIVESRHCVVVKTTLDVEWIGLAGV